MTVIITVVYPSIKSIKALESRESDDDKVWLTYWCVFGIFTVIDEFGGIVLSLIPFYFYIKLGFFLWLMLPQTRGASKIYTIILKPILDQHKEKINRIIE